MRFTRTPKKLEMQTIDYQRNCHFEFLASLLPVRRGWFANKTLQATPVGAFRSFPQSGTGLAFWPGVPQFCR